MDHTAEPADRHRLERLLQYWGQLDRDQRWKVAVISDRVDQGLELRTEERRWLIAAADLMA